MGPLLFWILCADGRRYRHPDRFVQKFGHKIEAADLLGGQAGPGYASILARVTTLSQALNLFYAEDSEAAARAR
eukprot:1690058-Pyramimonas_sp.AAC.1